MARPRLLDLFAGGGGAAVGYHRAGFDVVGIDVKRQPQYPFEFHQSDALAFLVDHGAEFDAIHASPPCQPYSPHVRSVDGHFSGGTRGKSEPRMIAEVRRLLVEIGRPYVIENVVGARTELRAPLLICGGMVGVPIPRHRLFETGGFRVDQPFHAPCAGMARRFADANGIEWDDRAFSVTGKGRRAGTSTLWARLLGVDWPMTQHQMRESVPPAYTHHIGARLFDVVAGTEV